MKFTRAAGKYFLGFILSGLFLLIILKVFGTLIPQMEGSPSTHLSPGDSAYPPGDESSEDSIYPPPNQTVQVPSPTTRFTDIPFQDLITRTIIPITPFPTLTLQPGPSATLIPLITPANDSEGTILYIAQKDADTTSSFFGLNVDETGNVIHQEAFISESEIEMDGFLFPSPDGNRLAIKGDWGIVNIYDIVQDKFFKTSIALGSQSFLFNWFPDSILIIKGSNSLSLKNTIDGNVNILTVAGYDGIKGAAASPDGRYIVFSYTTDKIYQSGLWLIDSTGQNLHLFSSGESASNISWSPDGKQIAFWGTSWEVMNADGSERRRIAEGVFLPQCYPLPPLWSPDSQTIAVLTSRSGDAFCHGWGDEIFDGTNIFLIDVETGKPNPLLTDGSEGNIDPAWSPDGSQMVFVSNRNGRPQLWAMNIDGSDLHALTENDTLVRFPLWLK